MRRSLDTTILRNTITRYQGLPFTDPGVYAHDGHDGNNTDQIVVTGTVDMNSTGTYLLTHTMQEEAGNTATATRTVTVISNPIGIIEGNPAIFTAGSTLTLSGIGIGYLIDASEF
jgi:hypothetical protein